MLISLRHVLSQLENKVQQPEAWSFKEIKDTEKFLGENFVACLTHCLNECQDSSDDNPQDLARSPMGLTVAQLYDNIKYQFYINILKKPNPTSIPKPPNSEPFQMPPWPSDKIEKRPLENEEAHDETRKKIRLKKTPTTSPVMLSRSLGCQQLSTGTTSPILNARTLSACAHESNDSPVQQQTTTTPSPILKAN